jgi:hypothetical protein
MITSHTICAGGTATLTAMNVNPSATFTWGPGGQNTSSIVVNPASTTAYTLAYTEPGGLCPDRTATVTIGSQLSMNLSASSVSVCAGESVTLTTQSSANTYSWSTGPTSHSIVVAPASNTTYVVGGTSNFTCFGTESINIGVNPTPVITAFASQTLLCAGTGSASITYSATGGSSYDWETSFGDISGAAITLTTAGTQSAAATYSFKVTGFNTSGCSNSDTVYLHVDLQPTVTIAGNTTVCANGTVALLASGADSYQWGGAMNSTLAAIVYTAGSTTGNQTFNLTGFSPNGCSDSENHIVNVVLCGTNTTVAIPEVYTETSIFPNPFSSELKISGVDGKVVIYNALGQVVLSTTVKFTDTINTSDFAKGTYIVQAYASNGEIVKTVRLVKN